MSGHIIVIGAGLSGLVAARSLRSRGFTATVVDARSRAGGRLKATTLGTGRTIDAGGQFSSLAEKPLQDLARELGIAWRELPQSPGALVRTHRGVRHEETFPLESDPDAAHEADEARRRIDELAATIDPSDPASAPDAAGLDAISVASWLRRRVSSPGALAVLAVDATAMGDPERISMLFFAWQVARFGGWKGFTEMNSGHFVGGAAQLPLRLAAEPGSDILFDTEVSEVRHDPRGVTVVSSAGPLRADAVVVATGGGATRIAFSPELPPRQRALADAWTPMHGVKAVYEYESAFWRDRGLTGTAIGDGFVNLTLDIGDEDGRGLLCVLVLHSKIVAEMTDSAIRTALDDDLDMLFGGDLPAPTAVHVENWERDAWSAGCGNSLPLGTLTAAGDAITATVGRIAWAGADRGETDYMNGAVTAGQRAAAQIAELLTDDAAQSA